MSMEGALKHAFEGPGKEKYKLLGHKFNVKKMNITRDGNTVTATGTFNHYLTMRPDDKVLYRIVKENGAIKDVKVKIRDGGFSGLVGQAGSILGAYFGVPLSAEQVEKASRAVGTAVTASSGWQDVVEAFVSEVALRLK